MNNINIEAIESKLLADSRELLHQLETESELTQDDEPDDDITVSTVRISHL